MRKRHGACLLAMLLCLTGCQKADGSSQAEQSTTTTKATTTTAKTTTTKTTTKTTTTETTTATTASTQSTEPLATNPNAVDDDTKLLWSERGLDIVPVDSKDGYGEPLTAGDTYLDWTLQSFDGIVSGETVSELYADFAYSGGLEVNGIITVLPATHADYPNGLYLRVDNLALFPRVTKDTREHGYYMVENQDEVYEMLKHDDSPVTAEYTKAVTFTISELHIHMSANGYNTITVTAASLR